MEEVHPHATLVNHIRGIIALDWRVSFQHTLREGNECADWLAKTGASSTQTLVHWDFCLATLAPTLLADAMAVFRLRI